MPITGKRFSESAQKRTLWRARIRELGHPREPLKCASACRWRRSTIYDARQIRIHLHESIWDRKQGICVFRLASELFATSLSLVLLDFSAGETMKPAGNLLGMESFLRKRLIAGSESPLSGSSFFAVTLRAFFRLTFSPFSRPRKKLKKQLD